MRKNVLITLGIIAAFSVGFSCQTWNHKKAVEANTKLTTSNVIENVKLGAFSVSLSVKDIHASKAFYEKLGFTYKAGDIEQNWIILKNGSTVIGLFQGMFEGNMLTCNPGWDQNADNLPEFDDVRTIQKHLKSSGLAITLECDEKSTGPASIVLSDPDGNVILMDQHR
jgi:hypothetical protein